MINAYGPQKKKYAFSRHVNVSMYHYITEELRQDHRRVELACYLFQINDVNATCDTVQVWLHPRIPHPSLQTRKQKTNDKKKRQHELEIHFKMRAIAVQKPMLAWFL